MTNRLLLVLFLALIVAVHCQLYPHFEFSGTVLVNNSYIRRGRIGVGLNNSLHCVTDNSNCCDNGLGNWYDERGSVVHQREDGDSDLYVTRGDRVVYLNRRTGGSAGMWRCDIPDSSGIQQSIYIYLGTQNTGRLTSPVISITLDSEPNVSPPEFTITCRSQGGPATTVQWRRNGHVVQEDSNHVTSQIIVDTSINTVYNNTLTIRGREDGLYVCRVNNTFPSSVTSTNLIIQSTQTPTQLNATYKSSTRVLLEWTYNTPPSIDYRYVVYYESQGGSHNVSFSIGNRRDSMYTYELTDVPVGGIHSISLVAIAQLPSPVVGPVTPVVAPPPVVSVSEDGSRVAGTSYTLTCRVTLPSGVQLSVPPNIQWVGLDTPTPVQISNGVYISNVTLNPLLSTNTVYICIASYTLNGVSSFQVQDSISISVITLRDPLVTVNDEGSALNNYSLICAITIPTNVASDATPTLLWTLPNGRILRGSTTSANYQYYSTRLPLTPLTHDDEGNYTCTAYYTVDGVRSPTANDTYHVTVQTPDSTDDVSVTVDVMGTGSGEDGSLYTLTCTVTLSHRASDSSLSIQWQGPGLSRSDDDDSTDNRVVVSELSLNPLTLLHGGDYTCTAEYTVDGQTTNSSGNTTVNVLIPAPVLMLRIGGRVDGMVLVGDTVILICDIELIVVLRGSDVTINVIWFQESTELANSTRLIIPGLTGDATDVQSTVIFSPVQMSDMATYECRVTLTPLLGLSSPVTTSDFIQLAVSELICSARGITEVEIICDYIASDITVQCSFNQGPEHPCSLPLILNSDVSPPGNHSIRFITGTVREATTSYVITAAISTVSAKVPPLEVYLINKSPRVTANSVEAEFEITRPVVGVRCYLRSQYDRVWRNCSSGRVVFTDLKPGLFILKVYAYNRRTDVATVKRGFVVSSDPTYCSLVLVNRGVTLSEDGASAVVEFQLYGPAIQLLCSLDGGRPFSCASPVELMTMLSAGRHKLVISPQGCTGGGKTLSVHFATKRYMQG